MHISLCEWDGSNWSKYYRALYYMPSNTWIALFRQSTLRLLVYQATGKAVEKQVTYCGPRIMRELGISGVWFQPELVCLAKTPLLSVSSTSTFALVNDVWGTSTWITRTKLRTTQNLIDSDFYMCHLQQVNESAEFFSLYKDKN